MICSSLAFIHAVAQAVEAGASTQPTESVVERLSLGETYEQTRWSAWLVLLLAIFVALAVGRLVQYLLKIGSDRLEARGANHRACALRDAIGPAGLALLAVGLQIGLAPIAMSDALRTFSDQVLRFLYILAAGWFAYNLVDLVDIVLKRWSGKTWSHLDDQVIPLVRKTLRIFLVVIFVLFVAENIFGADITAWLAGLGIAGLAVSLAAQDSIKNFFGSITIFLDRPFHVGELIVFDGHTGTVEEIGFRSTRLRTLNGEWVTVPNSRIVDNSVHNIGRRPHIRRVIDIAITYDTPPEKIDQAVQIVRDILAEPEMAAPFQMETFPPRVYFSDLASSSLNLKVFYWYYPNDYWAYMEHAQNFNRKLLRGFNDAGIDFAFPTQTLHLRPDNPRAAIPLRLVQDDGRGE